ncbi:drebrin-like protein B [Leptotrombidium deliense]|uniref:Drebrin-like protein B n=1 Tax=Leptotrombidium deliense TaxID=299467 RepID=A0A443SER6_9ACAR|nr:drebrin-like protein B [Leptotrombidium deliense]
MAISFKKNEDELRKAWKAVIDDKSDTNWALFTYEKQSSDLCLLSTGDNGLEELMDELNVAYIMYAFCRVIDPKTELPKYVLINWQGESAPLSRKGICVNHINDVSNFFRGAHITINARNEDEIEPEVIMQKVSMATATKYSFKQRSEQVEDVKPVGTNYKKIQPHREINVNERENFWTKQQEDEKRRKLEEKKKLEENRVKMEKEQRERELKETKERELLADKKDEEILKKREAEKNAENAARNELSRRLSLGSHDSDDDETSIKRKQNEIAKERSEETKKLLSQRSVKNARALFEQNSAAGQLSTIKANADQRHENIEMTVPSQAVTSQQESAIEAENVESAQPEQEEHIENEEYVEEDDTEGEDDEFVEEEVYDVRQISQAMDAMRYDMKYSEPLEDIAEETEEGSEDQSTEKIFDDHLDLEKEVFSVLDQGLKARALYDYQAADETEISFDPDDIITHIEQIDEGWWQGMGPNGTYGLFPANYVELIED